MEQDEKFTKLICKVCGGELRYNGSVYECMACGAKYEDGRAKSQNDILLVSAYEELRKGEFEDAIENFSIILSRDDTLSEAYWGKALAKNGIIFVDDLIEGKKVPTCQRISEKCFLKDADYLKALETSSGDIKENYQELGQKIENIRLEWLNKASKEKPYDIFVCFKDSDKEAGIERTNDSYEAQNLYTHLSSLGYRVFYSRESLRDKVAEQYEPYIYNALKTARVMIVYGQNPEYFSSTWMKNEWHRYARMVVDGDKHSASLIVVYEKFDPSLLPSSLRNKQCLDGSKKTFYGDLERHIQKIMDETTSNDGGSGVEKIEIGQGHVAKKVKQVQVAAVNLKKISQGNEFDLSLSEKKQIKVVERLLENELYTQAESLIDDVMTNNPNNAEALMFKLFVKYRSPNVSTFIALKSFKDSYYIEQVVNCSTKEFAASVLDIFYALAKNLIVENEEDALKLIDSILPYNYENRNANIVRILKIAIEETKPESFEKIICGIDGKDVDSHIKYLYDFAVSALSKKQFSLAKMYFIKTLKIDEGNINCLRGIIRTTTLSDVPCHECRYGKEVALKGHFDFVDFENLLKYLLEEDRKKEVIAVLDGLISEEKVTPNMVEMFNHIIRYYPSNISEIDKELSAMASRCIKCGFFDSALYYLRLRLEYDSENPEIFWNIIKAKAKASVDSNIVKSDIKVADMAEFMNFLAVADEAQTQRCLDLVKKQEANLARKMTSSNPYVYNDIQKSWDDKRTERESQHKVKNFFKDLKGNFKSCHFALLFAAVLFVCYLITFIMTAVNEFEFYSFITAESSYIAMIVFAVLGCINLIIALNSYNLEIRIRVSKKAAGLNNQRGPVFQKEKSVLQKKNNIVKIICISCILFILISIISVAIVTEGYTFATKVDFEKNGIYYTIEKNDGNNYVGIVGADKDKVKIVDTTICAYHNGKYYYVSKIYKNAFAKSNVRDVIIGKPCYYIGKNAFKGCKKLQNVRINFDDGKNKICDSAFKKCFNLRCVYIHSDDYGGYYNGIGHIKIDDEVFAECYNLNNVKLEANISEFGEKVFKNCYGIAVIIIPNYTTRLGDKCFEGWESNQKVYYPNTVNTYFTLGDFKHGSDADFEQY